MVRVFVALSMVGVSVWLGQYLAIVVAGFWGAAEWWAHKKKRSSIHRMVGGLGSLLTLYGKTDAASHRLLEARLSELNFNGVMGREQLKWIEKLSVLVELRSLLFGKHVDDRQGAIRSAFVYSRSPKWKQTHMPHSMTVSDLATAATWVSDLHWRLLEIASGSYGELTERARELYEEMFEQRFSKMAAQDRIEALTDSMQRDGGLTYVILNLVHTGRSKTAVALMRQLIVEKTLLDEDTRNTCYWIAELMDFKGGATDFDEMIRYLYHYCLVAPEQAEILEIDSPYFSQFAPLNEMAREGFLFKETLVDSLLGVWSDYRLFEPVFCELLAKLMGCRNKIYDSKEIWERVWNNMRGQFSREYLWVIEGNLAYYARRFSEADECYQEALKVEPTLPVSLMNRVFALAQMGDLKTHQRAVEHLMSISELIPKSLYIAGDSYLLLKDEAQAAEYFRELKETVGIEARVEYYQSAFCFEHGVLDLAVKFGEDALKREPNEASVRFHLSRCYSASGDKSRALEVLAAISSPPPWLDFYRFTLERDVGLVEDASATLYKLPRDYFEEETSLVSAVEFAKGTRNLALLRHLKSHTK